MAAISAFLVTQHTQIFSFFFRNQIQCIALYQLHNSQLCSTYVVATVVFHTVLIKIDHKGPVKLIMQVKIAHSFAQSVSNQFHVMPNM